MSRVHWLNAKTAVEGFPSYQKLEFKKKGPLVTASAVLETHFDGAVFTNKGTAEFKAPIWNEQSFEMHSTLLLKDREMPLESYGESFGKKYEWRGDVDGIENRQTGQMISKEKAAVLPAPLLDPLSAMALFGRSWAPGIVTMGIFVVAGRKTYTLRVDHMGGVNFKGAILPMPAMVTGEQWHDLDWRGANSFELTLNPEKKVVDSVSMKIPVMGKFSVRLSHFETR